MQEVPLTLTLTNFRQKLEDMGYQPFQIELIAKEAIGNIDRDKLAKADPTINYSILERYLSIANHCRSLRDRRTGTMECAW